MSAYIAEGRSTPHVAVFSWPRTLGRPWMTSLQCRAYLGTDVSDCASFRKLLTPSSAAAFDKNLLTPKPFALPLTLLDGRLIQMVAACEGDGADQRLSGTLDLECPAPGESTVLSIPEQLCRAVAEDSPAMLWMGDQFGKCIFLNRAQRDFWGVDPEDLSNFNWSETLHPEDIEKLSQPFGKAMAAQERFSVAARYRRADGQFRTLRTDARPRFDEAGMFLGMTGVNIDITDQLLAEERNRVLMGELNHRTKNILAVVQALARQTARSAAPEVFQKIFDQRLNAMVASNELLLKNEWHGATLSDLVDVQLRHLSDFIGHRIFISGPELRFTSIAAQTVGMALHELATNSLKHGALRGGDGRVDLTWTYEPGIPGYTVKWIERGDTTARVPAGFSGRKGFGHTVIVDMVASTLDAEVDVRLDAGGFQWVVSARSNIGLAE